MVFGKLKKKTKGKVTGTKDWLKEKWHRGSLQSGPNTPSGGEEEKKSIFGGLSKTIKGIGKKKCKNCGSPDIEKFKETNEYISYQCKKCNAYSNFYKKKKKKEDKPEKKEESGEEDKPEEKKEETPGKKITKGIVIFISIIIGGMAVAWSMLSTWQPELAQIALIAGILAILFTFLSIFFKHKWIVVLLWLLTTALVLLYMGYGQDYTFRVQAELSKGMDMATRTWDNFMCFTSTGDPNCWEVEEEEENVKKIGKYETLTLDYGRKKDSGTIEPSKPKGGGRYNLDITLTNENREIYDINITEIYAHAIGKDKENKVEAVSSVSVSEERPYVLKPEEDLAVRLKWDDSLDGGSRLPQCDRTMKFYTNITSQHQGGGFTLYGVAPREEGYVNFLHYFDPEITTEPGPLNIYVFTDPYAINLDEITSGETFDVIIKIVNKVKDSVAVLDRLAFVQTFEVPSGLFTINPSSCQSLVINLNYTTNFNPEGICTDDKHNCFELLFEPKELKLSYDESEEIECKATVTSSSISNRLTDQIRVYSIYTFVQDFDKSLVCAELSERELMSFCGDFGNEEDCKNRTMTMVDCVWCSQCDRKMVNTWNEDKCVSKETGCGYHCDIGECGATCERHGDCPSDDQRCDTIRSEPSPCVCRRGASLIHNK